MTDKDIDTCTKVFTQWTKDTSFKRILLINPDCPQEVLIRVLFPDADRVSIHYPNYDIGSGPPPDGPFDMIFLANTMLCSQDPGMWVDNLLSGATEVWMQESVRAWRNGEHGELSPETGDHCRFTFPRRGQEARVPAAFDLESHPGVEVIDIEFYDDHGAGEGRDCLKFVAKIRKKTEDARAAGSRDELPTAGDPSQGKGRRARRDTAG